MLVLVSKSPLAIFGLYFSSLTTMFVLFFLDIYPYLNGLNDGLILHVNPLSFVTKIHLTKMCASLKTVKIFNILTSTNTYQNTPQKSHKISQKNLNRINL